jgi:nicotinamide riboside kinase
LQVHGFTRDDIRNVPTSAMALQALIATAQFHAEEAQLQTNRWFISDRSSVDPIVYARLYVNREAADMLTIMDIWKQMKGRMAGSLVILCPINVSWLQDDGVRLIPHDHAEWEKMHTEFLQVLADFGMRYYLLPPNVSDQKTRVEYVVQLWEEKKKELANTTTETSAS